VVNKKNGFYYRREFEKADFLELYLEKEIRKSLKEGDFLLPSDNFFKLSVLNLLVILGYILKMSFALCLCYQKRKDY